MKLMISSADTYFLERATTQGPQPDPNRVVISQKEIQSLRDNARQQVRAAFGDAQGRGGANVDQAPPGPMPPDNPRVITIRNGDGTHSVISVPSGLGRDVIPQQVVDISIAFFLTMAAIIIGLPLARAFGRRMDRRGSGQQIPSDLSHQIGQLNQAVDAIALEVERISEGQRFTTRLLSEQRDSARASLPASTPQ
ncbi:MAG: hypothetical protein ACR2NS_10720 [Gemmatimonadaceae bacterium]